jgi:hypothetical protein
VPSVLGVVSAGAALGAVGLMGRWFTRRKDALGRDRDLPVWSVSALVVVAVVAAVPGARHKVLERRLTNVAESLVGHKVKVHCQSGAAAFVDAGAELGWVPFDSDGVPEPQTLIKIDQCHYLSAYRSGDQGHPTEDEVVAVHVLTHESMHMRGEPNEAKAECEAVQRDELTAIALGANQAQARQLSELYYLTVYPRMPDDYFSSSCKAGGSMDEGLPSAPWATPTG